MRCIVNSEVTAPLLSRIRAGETSARPTAARNGCPTARIEFQLMLEQQLSELQSGSLARIASAASAEELEQVRIDFLGRKGSLAQISKEMGRIPAGERAAAGKLLNATKQAIEAALEVRQ